MPSIEDGKNIPAADEAMSGPADYASEFIFDSDEGSPLPCLGTDFVSDALQPFEDSRPAGLRDLFCQENSVPQSDIGPRSVSGFQDSIFDSNSSKRAESSSSTKTTLTGVDVTMSDGVDVKTEEWKIEDFVHTDDDPSCNGKNNQQSADDFLPPIEQASGGRAVLRGCMDGSSPFGGETATDSLSPQADHAAAITSGSHALSPFTPNGSLLYRENAHLQQQHYPLGQTLNRHATGGSREVSPLSNFVTSQESSPSAVLNSPSPSMTLDLNALAFSSRQIGSPMWSNALDRSPGPVRQAGAGQPPAVPIAMHAPIAAAHFPFQQPYNNSRICQLRIHPTPLKSRVETQIPIRMTLSPLPPGVKRLHLPKHTISKPKLLAKPPAERSPDMLELHTALVCTSAMQDAVLRENACQRARAAAQALRGAVRIPEATNGDGTSPQNGGEVHICSGCVTRERKRAARKKVKKPEDEHLWLRDEHRRVIVFNTNEVKEWQHAGYAEHGPISAEFQIDAPMRIACYCRHHQEKLGFQVIFTITDFRGDLVAQAMSNSIMITDDHKTHATPGVPGTSVTGSEASLTSPAPGAVQDANNPTSSPQGGLFRGSHPAPDISRLKAAGLAAFPASVVTAGAPQAASAAATPRNLSRPASPTGASGPSSKKRKASGSVKVPSGLAMTRIETTSNPQARQPSSQKVQGPLPTATSPFSPDTIASFAAAGEALFGQGPFTASQIPTGPPTPSNGDQMLFSSGNNNPPGGLDSLAVAQTQLFSASSSARPSRAPSPSSARTNPAAMHAHQHQQHHQKQTGPVAQSLAASIFTVPVALGPSRPPSIIHKIIPSEGPKVGGIEVTILGSGFYQGLEVMFGESRATTTTYWGETSLVCLLPPSPQSGSVLVTLNHQSAPASQQMPAKQTIFKYVDDDEQQLMRTALTVLGNKMRGDFENVGEIARRIIGNVNTQWGNSPAPDGQRRGGAPFAPFEMSLEVKLLKILELIDLDDSTHKPRLNLRRSTGQTMLHLACSSGLHRFAAGLLARGANPDLRDKGGHTALHLASLNDHPEIVRRLISYGADPTIRTLSGLTAADVARSREVIRAIRRVEKHARSQSSGSLHSRASSVSSLRSLWESPSEAQAEEEQGPGEETGSAEESPEYSSEEMASEVDPDIDDGPWLDMRRRGTDASQPQDQPPKALPRPVAPDVPAGLSSPTAAVTALKEQMTAQFHQFQQTMALHLQNLPQLPQLSYLPQMPHMPPLADYQAYLNSAAVFQRLTSMVPTMGSSRPGSAGDQPAGKELDGRWWDISSLMSSSSPPPSYEDIFPRGDLDTKQASAAQAAAEAEADQKCAALYDQQGTSGSTSTPKARQKLPALLQIGRKNAITREQRENLRRAHAEKFKRLSRDRNLFFIWIPLLIVVVCAMAYGRFPGLFRAGWEILPKLAGRVAVAVRDRAVPAA